MEGDITDFSIVCCISKPDVFEKCLLHSVNACRADYDIEIIPIINDDNSYSASNALNVGINICKSDIVILAHQDVYLRSNWFQILDKLLDKTSDGWGIIGAAGIALQYGREDIGCWGGALYINTVAVGSVWGDDETELPYWDGDKNLTPVHCADECLLVVNKKTGLRLNEMLDGFHCYGIDICLQARALKYDVYCAHLPITHYEKHSNSMVGNSGYWRYLRYTHNKWKSTFPEMFGTHMHWIEDELTSYISIGLESNDGAEINFQASFDKIILN